METVIENGLLRVPNNKYADDNVVYPFRGRKINLEKPIKVYKNLHKNCYSIKQGTLVVAHAERLCLRGVVFKVNEKNRQKVIETKQKNVHAFMEGFYTTCGMGTTAKINDLPAEVYYNPYKTKQFVYKTNSRPLNGARFVIADEIQVRASYTH